MIERNVTCHSTRFQLAHEFSADGIPEADETIAAGGQSLSVWRVNRLVRVGQLLRLGKRCRDWNCEELGMAVGKNGTW